MRRLKWGISGLLVILVLLVLWGLKGQPATVVRNETSTSAKCSFLKEIAKEAGKEPISIQSNGRRAVFTQLGTVPYVSQNAELMVPAAWLKQEFFCTVLAFPDGRVRVEGGNTFIELPKNKTGTRNGQLFVPLEEIAEAFHYSFQWDKMQYIAQIDHKSEMVLPRKYDYRLEGRTSAVRDQGRSGTCWAFASLGAMETTLMPQEIGAFSTDHMSLQSGFHLTQAEGGEYNMAMAYLASWKGPILEEEDPYGDQISPEGLKAVKHLEQAVILPERDMEAIKRAVYLYGGVETSIFTSLKNADSWSRFYKKENAAFYFHGNEKANHDVVIVGWDDDFPRERFSDMPPADGAFICKNSWGTDFGEQGYFYISYYDSNVAKTNVVYSGIGAANNFDHNYQADQLGWTGQLGYNRDSAFFANVYTSKGSEDLWAVSFYATGPDTNYEVYTVKKFKDKESLNNRVYQGSGHFDYAGYYTVRFDKPVKLEPNEKFAVVVKIKTPGSIHPVPIEYHADWRTANFDVADGEGYISAAGEKWSSVEENQNCNLCLKAFTKDRG